MQFVARRDSILQQLNVYLPGAMRTGERKLPQAAVVDTTDAYVTRLLEHKQMFDDLLTNLTRQPSGESQSSFSVHWYHLKRMTPKYAPPKKDDWSLPGETSPEAALAFFERHSHLGHGLELCDEGDMRADFLLEQLHVLRSQHGASYRIQPGELVKVFYVRPI